MTSLAHHSQDPDEVPRIRQLASSVLDRLEGEITVTCDRLEEMLPVDLTAEQMDEVFYALSESGITVTWKAKKAPPPLDRPEQAEERSSDGAMAVATAGTEVLAKSHQDSADPPAKPDPGGLLSPEQRASGVMGDYMSDISEIPNLDSREEEALASRVASGDEQAANVLVESHLRLVVKICHDYRHSGLNRMDLIQAGNMGLLDAAHHYKPGKASRFSQFASWWIRQAVTRHVQASGLLIRIPRKLVKELHSMGRQKARMLGKLKREPTDAEIATALEWPISKVEFLSSLGKNPLSLDAPLPSDKDKTFEEVVEDTKATERARNTRKQHVIASLRPFLERLTTAEKSVISLRFGLDDQVEHSVREVSHLTSLPREEVRRVEREGLSKLATLSASVLPGPFEDDD